MERLISCIHVTDGMYARLAQETVERLSGLDLYDGQTLSVEVLSQYVDGNVVEIRDEYGNSFEMTARLSVYVGRDDTVCGLRTRVTAAQAFIAEVLSYNIDGEQVANDFKIEDFNNILNNLLK